MKTFIASCLGQRIYRLFLLIVFAIAVSACSSADMVIIDPASGRISELPQSTFRQVVVKISDASSQFSTISLDDTRKSALLRQYDAQGSRLNDTVVPKFLDGYAGGGDYDLSPDVSKIIYKSHADLRLLDLATKQDVILWAGAMPEFGRALVRWITNDRVLLVSELPERNGEEPSRLFRIMLVDVSAGKQTQIYRHVYMSNVPRPSYLSPDRSQLVIQDVGVKHGFYAKCIVLDLRTGEQIGSFRNGEHSYYGAMSWSADGKELAFVESTKGEESDSIKIWRQSDQTIRQLLREQSDHLIYGVIWAGESIGYYSGKSGSRHSGLILVDTTTGQDVRKVNVYVNGNLYYLPIAKRIIAEVN